MDNTLYYQCFSKVSRQIKNTYLNTNVFNFIVLFLCCVYILKHITHLIKLTADRSAKSCC